MHNPGDFGSSVSNVHNLTNVTKLLDTSNISNVVYRQHNMTSVLPPTSPRLTAGLPKSPRLTAVLNT